MVNIYTVLLILWLTVYGWVCYSIGKKVGNLKHLEWLGNQPAEDFDNPSAINFVKQKWNEMLPDLDPVVPSTRVKGELRG